MFFFVKQKTAYDMRISDWSSDVCSSDLYAPLPRDLPPFAPDKPLPVADIVQRALDNGLKVWVVPRDGVPRVDYVLAVRGAGYAADAARSAEPRVGKGWVSTGRSRLSPDT